MKFFPLLVGFSIITSACPAIAQSSVWKSFTSRDGGFSVLLPGQPTIIEEQIKSTKVRKFVLENLAQGAVYMVIYSNRRTNDFQMITQNGRLVSQRNIVLQNHRGQENIYESAKEIIKHRTYYAGNRVYQVAASIDKQKYKYLARSTEGFLNSFRITRKTHQNLAGSWSAFRFNLHVSKIGKQDQ